MNELGTRMHPEVVDKNPNRLGEESEAHLERSAKSRLQDPSDPFPCSCGVSSNADAGDANDDANGRDV